MLLAAIGALLFAWSGLYNVAASTGHFSVTAWFLHFGMENSVATHAGDLEPLPHDPALVERAAAHFETGCAPCHGSPSKPGDLILSRMVPAPPDLAPKIAKWDPGELFWIIRNGIKYAGMPAWPTSERDDEVAAMTMLLLKLPQMSAETYDALAGPAAVAPTGSELAALSGQAADAPASLAGCPRCHGIDGAGRTSGAFPHIGGQTESYLRRALIEYADGTRPSGIMQPVASSLKPNEIDQLARHFAGAAVATADAVADPTRGEIGLRIATMGSGKTVAACAACHGLEAGPARPDYPALAGQYPDYIVEQLRLFRDGRRGRTAHGAIMAAAIRGITEAEIAAAAQFYGRLPRSGH